MIHYFGLSALYTFNNQLSFYALEVADPGSMSLGKSVRRAAPPHHARPQCRPPLTRRIGHHTLTVGRRLPLPRRAPQVAPYLCALLLRFTGQSLHSLQWVCVIIQCCAIAIVQYDACKGTGVLPVSAPRTALGARRRRQWWWWWSSSCCCNGVDSGGGSGGGPAAAMVLVVLVVVVAVVVVAVVVVVVVCGGRMGPDVARRPPRTPSGHHGRLNAAVLFDRCVRTI